MTADLLSGPGNATTATSTTGLTATVGRPSLTAVGDLLAAFVGTQTLNGSTTPPPGWVKVSPATFTGNRTLEMWVLPVADAAALAALPDQWTWTGVPATASRWVVAVHRVVGVNLAAAIAATPTPIASVSPFAVVNVPATTGLVDPDGLTIVVAHATVTAAQGNPVWADDSAAGWTRVDALDTTVSGAGSGDSLMVETHPGPASALTVNSGRAALSGLQAFAVALAPAVTAPAATAGVSVVADGAEVDALLTVWDGAAELPVTAATVKAAPFTVAELLAGGRVFDVAHRGFSKTYPEMTRWAYVHAANRGVKALECSVQRSSDGVFVLHHDTDTLRMTGVKDVIASTPWATLAQLTNTAALTTNTSQPRRPMARIEEVVDLYAWDHVLFIEDKSGANADALLAYIQTIPNYAERVVWKVYGPMTSVAAKGKALGLTTWGFYFDVDMPSFASTNGAYDMLGVDVNSTDATITSAIATAGSRPVIGHVIDTVARRNHMIALGCDGLMTSNESTLP